MKKTFFYDVKESFFCLSLSCLRILADGDVMKQLNEKLESYLAFGSSFDLVCRRLLVQDRQYSFYFVDGFVKDEIMERLMTFLLKRDFDPDASLEKQLQTLIPYVEAEVCRDVHKAALAVLSGVSVLYPQDADGFLCIDVRTYPTRSMSEPEDDRVLRGARDGFVETLIFNTALIRRRIRDPRLRMEHFAIGDMRDDVVLCTIEGVCSAKLHEELACRLRGLDVHALTMGQESLAEALLQRHWWQLFPMVRYSERPDVACAHLQEGGAVIIVDNSPSVLLLPLSLFDFVQEAQDYYFPPLVGTYLRFVRILVFVMAQFLTPLWFWFSLNPQLMPSFFRFALIQGESNLGIFWQLMVLELGIDAIKPWGHVGDIGAAIMEHAHKHGYHVVRDFAGHGVGNGFHEDPIVPHVGMRGTGMVLAPGMVITVEPMINIGGWELFIDEENGWTAYTEDGSLSAQWEHTIYIGEHGVEIIAY